jgi:hypothetical protein
MLVSGTKNWGVDMEYDIRLKKCGVVWQWFVINRHDDWAHKTNVPEFHCLSHGWALTEEGAKRKGVRRALEMKDVNQTGNVDDYIVPLEEDVVYEEQFTKLRNKLKKEV